MDRVQYKRVTSRKGQNVLISILYYSNINTSYKSCCERGRDKAYIYANYSVIAIECPYYACASL